MTKGKTSDRCIELLARGVCVRDGCVLVCRNRRRGNVYLPGGHVKWGESAREALRREIFEELGVPVKVGRFLGACESTFVQQGKRVCEISLCFEMRAARLRPPHAPPSVEEKIEFFWIPLRGIAKSDLLPDLVRARLVRWIKNARRADAHWASRYGAGIQHSGGGKKGIENGGTAVTLART